LKCKSVKNKRKEKEEEEEKVEKKRLVFIYLPVQVRESKQLVSNYLTIEFQTA
jgi:hypothetical protein